MPGDRYRDLGSPEICTFVRSLSRCFQCKMKRNGCGDQMSCNTANCQHVHKTSSLSLQNNIFPTRCMQRPSLEWHSSNCVQCHPLKLKHALQFHHQFLSIRCPLIWSSARDAAMWYHPLAWMPQATAKASRSLQEHFAHFPKVQHHMVSCTFHPAASRRIQWWSGSLITSSHGRPGRVLGWMPAILPSQHFLPSLQ